MNIICLVGRLTRDCELKYTPNGVAVAGFSLAVDRDFKNKDGEKEADFFNCKMFQKRAESLSPYLLKGKMIAVEGRVQTGSYTDKEGVKKFSFDVMINSIQFVGGKKDGNQAQTPQPQPQQSTNNGDFGGYADPVDDGEDIPF